MSFDRGTGSGSFFLPKVLFPIQSRLRVLQNVIFGPCVPAWHAFFVWSSNDPKKSLLRIRFHCEIVFPEGGRIGKINSILDRVSLFWAV